MQKIQYIKDENKNLILKQLKYAERDLITDLVNDGNYYNSEWWKEKMIAMESEFIWWIECADPDGNEEHFIFDAWYIDWYKQALKDLLTNIEKNDN